MKSLKTECIAKPPCLKGTELTFLNLSSNFSNWNFRGYGMLWAYNLNYMDWLGQENIGEVEGCKWIDCFIKNVLHVRNGRKIGLDPYPIALRVVNWCKFFCRWPQAATQYRLDALYSQVRLLELNQEFHLLGNHLLEDYFSLFIASLFFNDERLFQLYSKKLFNQLGKQVLEDGAHFEQSPMYHCIMLDRLLDCCNFCASNSYIEERKAAYSRLCEFAERMLGHLSAITFENGDIPLMNDSAVGIAPTSHQILDYSKRLGVNPKEIPLGASGYRKMKCGCFEAIVDIGNITATYQPGHTHADTLNYELRLNGRPIVVDTGISTYEKTQRRQYERSSAAHNTVTIGDNDSSEVWGGFRVGGRSRVALLVDEEHHVEALCKHYKGNKHRRSFRILGEMFSVTDWVDEDAVSRIHLAPGVSIVDIEKEHDNYIIKTDKAIISINGAEEIMTCDSLVSNEYNRFQTSKSIEIKFNHHLNYSIYENSISR